MTGRILPAARPQKPSPQPPAPPAAPPLPPKRTIPTWRTGDRVRWQRYTGTYLRETIGGEAELLIGQRTYRVPVGELRRHADTAGAARRGAMHKQQMPPRAPQQAQRARGKQH